MGSQMSKKKQTKQLVSHKVYVQYRIKYEEIRITTYSIHLLVKYDENMPNVGAIAASVNLKVRK